MTGILRSAARQPTALRCDERQRGHRPLTHFSAGACQQIRHRLHFGQDGDVLVVQGPSTAFNPNLSQSEVDAAVAADPEGATAEWTAEFRRDISAFLDDQTIDYAIDHGRPLELPPQPGLHYQCFVDASGGAGAP